MDTRLDYPLIPATPVGRPVMLQSWNQVGFVHWRYDPEYVQRRLPDGLAVDTFDGSAWVGVVAFRMERIRLPSSPPVPYFGTFPETNVRTYVRGPGGLPGVWFDSLDITRLAPVIVARTTYRLPYMWARMSIATHGRTVSYGTLRRWPRSKSAASLIRLERGESIAATDVDDLDRFLTARWGLYASAGSKLIHAAVDHPAWPLDRARANVVYDGLVEAAGYPAPSSEPVAHYSPGVDVRIGRPHMVDV